MAAISKVIRLSQKLRGAAPSMSTLCIGCVGRRFKKKYCRIHHAIVSAIWEAIREKWRPFAKETDLSVEIRDRESSLWYLHISFMGNIIHIVH